MAIHFYPKVGGRVDFDTPEEAARFFEITGGGTVEAPKPKSPAATVLQSAEAPVSVPAAVTEVTADPPKVRKRKSSLKQRLEDSLQIILGGRVMTAPELHKELTESGWLPDSKDPLNYIRYTLSSNKAIFKNESRGKYRLDPSNPYAVGEHKTPIDGHVNPKTTKAKAATNPVAIVAKNSPQVVEPKVEEPPEVVEAPEVVEVNSSEPEVTVPVVEQEGDDTESLVAQLSEETVETPVIIEPPVVVEEPKPVVVVAPPPTPPVVVAPPTPVKLVAVKPPEIDGSEDPVADILTEFANELGSLV